MHSAIFVASIPERENQGQIRWSNFLGYVDVKLKNPKNYIRLAENVWLLHLKQSVAELGWLTVYAEQQAIKYGIVSFENAPEWLPGGFDPNTIQGRISL